MVSTAVPVSAADQRPPEVPAREPRPRRFTVPLFTCVIVAALAQLPLLNDPWVYYTDDAATQVLPMWYHLGERVLSGSWPPVLDLHTWMGGNLAAEALFGVFSPANAVLWAMVSLSPDLFIAGVLVRTLAYVLLAMGCYALSREYGAARWASSAVAVVLPFTGSLFYFDAPKWPAALVAGVWVPFLWLAARRMARGKTNAIWVFLIGAMAIAAGNPYSTLAVCLVLLGLLVETALVKRWRSLRDLFLVSVLIGCIAPLVYLPLMLSSSVTWRSSGGGIGFSGVLTPHLRDLVNFSVPSYVPGIPNVFDAAIYFCWFAMPLAAWLDWGVIRRRWRELAGVLVTGGLFLLIARGPSEMWMFRWPLRTVHYGYLALAVLFAVLLTAGIRTDRLRLRLPAMAALFGLNLVLVFRSSPNWQMHQRHLLSFGLIVVLAVAAIMVYRFWGSRWLTAVLHLGTAVTLGLQVFWFLGYHGATPYYFPDSPAQARANYMPRYTGEVFQVSDTNMIGPPDQPREAWRDLLPGNLFHVTGVSSANSYTGIGFTPFIGGTCMRYAGQTCAGVYPALIHTPPGLPAPLADLFRVDTIVVQRKLIDSPEIADGWRVTDRNARITVLQRTKPLGRPDGRLSWASPGVTVGSDLASGDQHEAVRFTRSAAAPARLIFARLAWPGYTATLNGAEIPTRIGPSGLLEVELPPNVHGGQLELSWQPPGFRLGLAFALVGVLGAAAVGALQFRRRRAAAVETGGTDS